MIRGGRSKLLNSILILCMVISILVPALPAAAEEPMLVEAISDGVPCVPMAWLVKGYTDTQYDVVYTASQDEINYCLAHGWWKYGDSRFYVSPVQLPGLVPFYRCYHSGNKDHYFTTSWDAVQAVAAKYGFKYEGIAGFVAPTESNLPDAVPLYQWYGTYETFHYYDAEKGNLPWLESRPRQFEGTACKVWKGWVPNGSPFTPIIGPPAAPAALTAKGVAGTRIDLSWVNQSKRAKGFKIERRIGAGPFQWLADVGLYDKSYSDIDVKPNTTYGYRMVSYNDWGNSEYSQEVEVKTPTEIMILSPNGGEEWDAANTNQIKWSSTASGSGKVNLFYSVDTGLTWTKINQTAAENNGSYSWKSPNMTIEKARIKVEWIGPESYDPKVQPQYILWAKDTSDANFTFLGLSAPAAEPASDLQGSVVSGKVQLTWSDNSNTESGFSVERKDPGGQYGLLKTLGKNVESYTDDSVSAGKTYIYRIRTWNGAKPSQPSNELTIKMPAASIIPGLRVVRPIFSVLQPLPDNETTIPAGNLIIARPDFRPVLGTRITGQAPTAPTDLKATPVGSSAVSLSWKAPANAGGLTVERSQGSSFQAIITLPGSASGYVDYDVLPGTSYSYRIMAFNTAGKSGYSGTVRAKTGEVQPDSAPQTGGPSANTQVPSGGSATITMKLGSKSFIVNNQNRTLDAPPVSQDGRTLLPIRALIEALGGTVEWNGSEKKATVKLGSQTVEAWLGQSTGKVNGSVKPIDPANSQIMPVIVSGRTLLPLRFVAENLGCDVKWNPSTKEVTISYDGIKK